MENSDISRRAYAKKRKSKKEYFTELNSNLVIDNKNF